MWSKTRELVLLSLLAAILVLAQVSLAVIPNVELVSLLCIIYTLFFKKKALFIIYTFVVVEGFLFGFGIWWFTYLYIWTILWALTMLTANMQSAVWFAILSGFFGLLFGAFTAIPYLFIGGPTHMFSYWVSGLVFDVTHCIGNVVTALLLFRPLSILMERLLGVTLWQRKD